MNTSPNEIIHLIISFLDVSALCRLASVSKYFVESCADGGIWKCRMKKDHPRFYSAYLVLKEEMPWKQCYQESMSRKVTVVTCHNIPILIHKDRKVREIFEQFLSIEYKTDIKTLYETVNNGGSVQDTHWFLDFCFALPGMILTIPCVIVEFRGLETDRDFSLDHRWGAYTILEDAEAVRICDIGRYNICIVVRPAMHYIWVRDTDTTKDVLNLLSGHIRGKSGFTLFHKDISYTVNLDHAQEHGETYFMAYTGIDKDSVVTVDI